MLIDTGEGEIVSSLSSLASFDGVLIGDCWVFRFWSGAVDDLNGSFNRFVKSYKEIEPAYLLGTSAGGITENVLCGCHFRRFHLYACNNFFRAYCDSDPRKIRHHSVSTLKFCTAWSSVKAYLCILEMTEDLWRWSTLLLAAISFASDKGCVSLTKVLVFYWQ